MSRLTVVHGTWIGFLALLLSNVSIAGAGWDTSGVDWDGFSRELTLQKKTFAGYAKYGKRWEGTLCNGYYGFVASISGKVGAMKFEPKGQSSAEVTATLKDVAPRLDGQYKSALTFCTPIGGWIGVDVDTVEIKIQIDFVDNGDDKPPSLKLSVLSTELGRVRFSSYFPDWFEEFMTKMINAAVKRVFATNLGEWINQKLTDEINKKLPHGLMN